MEHIYYTEYILEVKNKNTMMLSNRGTKGGKEMSFKNDILYGRKILIIPLFFLFGCTPFSSSTHDNTAVLERQSNFEHRLLPNDQGLFEDPSIPPFPFPDEVIEINDNIPFFSSDDITMTETYHLNEPLDELGRVGTANALIGPESMPASDRSSISHFEPTGWNQARYATIGSGGWLYNRSHLIAYQLTGYDTYDNLMTGTRWFNEEMISFENFISFYIEEEENHVRFRVTPIFENDNLLSSGAYMEAFSIEDNGEGVMFNIYIPNKQDGIIIDYSDGSSTGAQGPTLEGEISEFQLPSQNDSSDDNQGYIKGNINSSGEKIYHMPGDVHYERTQIDPTKGERYFKSEEEAEKAGWRRSKQ